MALEPQAAAQAQPAEVTTPTPSTPAPAAVTPAAEPAPTPDDVDPDARELAEALAAASAEEPPAEETANGGEPPADPAAVAQPAATPEPAATPASEPTTVPLAAVTAEREKRQAAERAASYWKGRAEGGIAPPASTTAQPATPAPAAPAQRTPNLIRADMEALAAQVDEGTLSTLEFERKRAVLDDELFVARQPLVAQPVAGKAEQSIRLAELTSEIERAEPWVAKVPPDEWKALRPAAIRQLESEGHVFKNIEGTEMGDYLYRKALATVGKRRNLHMDYPADTPAAAPAAPSNPAPAKPAATPSTTQVAAKVKLAAAAPPAVSGTPGTSETWTPDRVLETDDVDLENLSSAELDHILNAVNRQEATRLVKN